MDKKDIEIDNLKHRQTWDKDYMNILKDKLAEAIEENERLKTENISLKAQLKRSTFALEKLTDKTASHTRP
jgi:regulator of replication initiation timing